MDERIRIFIKMVKVKKIAMHRHDFEFFNNSIIDLKLRLIGERRVRVRIKKKKKKKGSNADRQMEYEILGNCFNEYTNIYI